MAVIHLKGLRELSLEHRETAQTLSAVGVVNLIGADPSTSGSGEPGLFLLRAQTWF